MGQSSGLEGSCFGSWSDNAKECKQCTLHEECSEYIHEALRISALSEVASAAVACKREIREKSLLKLPVGFGPFNKALLSLQYVSMVRGTTIIKYICARRRMVTVLSPVHPKRIVVKLHKCIKEEFIAKEGVLYDRDPGYPGTVFLFPQANN